MLGLMQEWPLLCHKLIDNAAIQHGGREVVSRSVEGPIVRITYAELRRRALQAAQRLERDGYGLGDRVATLAWNTARHLEAWYGIMGIGAIYHTLNPRLFPDQIAWIMNHAQDRALFVDLTFLPLAEKIVPLVPSVEKVIVLTDAAHMPATSLPGAVAAGFLLGILQSFASITEVKSLVPGIDQVIIYLVAVVILLVRPRGLMGRRGVMES